MLHRVILAAFSTCLFALTLGFSPTAFAQPAVQACRTPQVEAKMKDLSDRILRYKKRVIPKLRNDNSYYPTLCGDDRFVNVSQIKDLDGHNKPAETPQVGCG